MKEEKASPSISDRRAATAARFSPQACAAAASEMSEFCVPPAPETVLRRRKSESKSSRLVHLDKEKVGNNNQIPSICTPSRKRKKNGVTVSLTKSHAALVG